MERDGLVKAKEIVCPNSNEDPVELATKALKFVSLLFDMEACEQQKKVFPKVSPKAKKLKKALSASLDLLEDVNKCEVK